MTTPDHIKPAAGTGGAALRRDLGPAKYELGRRLAEIHFHASTWEGAAEQAAALFAPDVSTPSAVPERAAVGGGLPEVEELDRYEELATWLFEWKYPSKPYADMMRVSSPDVRENWLKVARNTAPTFAAILARLAQPRPAAAHSQPLESGVASDAAPGRVNAGAARKAVNAWLEHEYGSDSFADAMGELNDALALDAALDRAGEGWKACLTCFTPDACRSWQMCGATPPSTSTEPSP